MYLIFFIEDLTVIPVDIISDDDRQMCDDGNSIIIDIDISKPGRPTKYVDGEWEAL